MNDEKIISPAGLAAGQKIKPGYGVGLPEVHVGDIKHKMTPIDQLQAEGRTTTSSGSIPLRQIMQDIVTKDKMSRRQEMPVVEEVVAEEPKPEVKVNPHKKQSLQRAVQRQTEADLREPEAMFDDTQKAMREASDKIRTRSMRDKSAVSEQMSVSEMMARDAANSSLKSKKASAVRKAPATEVDGASDEISKGKSLEAKVDPMTMTGPLKKSTGKTKQKAEEAVPSVAVWQSSVSDLNKKFEVPIKAKEGSQGLKRVEHHNMSRSDRLAALEAKLGGTVAKVQQNEAEQQLDE